MLLSKCQESDAIRQMLSLFRSKFTLTFGWEVHSISLRWENVTMMMKMPKSMQHVGVLVLRNQLKVNQLKVNGKW